MKTAALIRVSTVGQSLEGQRDAIATWLRGNGIDPETIIWIEDKQTGNNLNRPGLMRLRQMIFNGEISTVVMFKLDRLSRNMREGLDLLCEWCERDVRVVSVTQQIDLTGWVGKMIAAVLLGIAEGENETRMERQMAGIRAAKLKKKYKGSEKGRLHRHTQARLPAIRTLYLKGCTHPREIADAIGGISEDTVARLLKRFGAQWLTEAADEKLAAAAATDVDADITAPAPLLLPTSCADEPDGPAFASLPHTSPVLE